MRRNKIRKFTEAQQEFMRFLALPEAGRNTAVQTYEEFARSIGVSKQTLFNWEKLPGFYEALQAMARRSILELEPEFLKRVAANMMSNKPNDRMVMTYWRYIRPALLAEQDITDTYLELKADNTKLLEERQQRIWDRIMELPAATRDTVFDILKEATTEPDEPAVEVLVEAEGNYRTRALAAPISRHEPDGVIDVEGTLKTGATVPPTRSRAGRPRMTPTDKHRLRPIK